MRASFKALGLQEVAGTLFWGLEGATELLSRSTNYFSWVGHWEVDEEWGPREVAGVRRSLVDQARSK